LEINRANPTAQIPGKFSPFLPNNSRQPMQIAIIGSRAGAAIACTLRRKLSATIWHQLEKVPFLKIGSEFRTMGFSMPL
jgi:hypothetical protein